MTNPVEGLKVDLDKLGKLGDPEPQDPTQKKQRRQRSDAGVPRGSRTGTRKPRGMSDADLKDAVEELLVLPAIPAALVYPTIEGKMYLTTHYATTAPWGAEKLVAASKLSPSLRRILEKVREESAVAMLIPFALIYFGAPALYVIGQHTRAEGLTNIAALDESAIQKMVEAQQQNMMQAMQQQQNNGVFMEYDNGEQAQSESDTAQG